MIATLASWRPREAQRITTELANSNPAQSITGKRATSSQPSHLSLKAPKPKVISGRRKMHITRAILPLLIEEQNLIQICFMMANPLVIPKKSAKFTLG
jgi:hypothetical protein